MKRFVSSLIAALMCSIVLMGSPQDQPQPAPSAANGPFAKLRNDLSTAVKNAHLTDDQKKTLQDAASRLREAAQARQSGNKVDRESVKKAISEIRRVTESGAFQPNDMEAVKADLDALRDARKGSRRQLYNRE